MKNRPRTEIPNALDEKSEVDSTRTEKGEKQKRAPVQKKRVDWFKLMFRGIMSLIVGLMVSGVGAGIIEAGTERTIDFGSWLMLGISAATVVGFWVLFTFIGPYKDE
ncbi:MAG: hypothetical protein JJU46_05260 [Balneolaceae bacterium]|nr:hypothetical protein [Balneolaceae bacterium]MCH8549924.1 hypothetical protein [Balneolaceae bacterium]